MTGHYKIKGLIRSRHKCEKYLSDSRIGPIDNIFMFVVIGLSNCDFIHNIKLKIGDNGEMEKMLFGWGSGERFISKSGLYLLVNNIGKSIYIFQYNGEVK